MFLQFVKHIEEHHATTPPNKHIAGLHDRTTSGRGHIVKSGVLCILAEDYRDVLVEELVIIGGGGYFGNNVPCSYLRSL